MSLRDKVVLVTGASRGIGAAIARELHSRGAYVAINYKSSAAAAEELKRSLGDRAEAFKADVSDRSEVKKLVGAVAEKFGGIDAVVNNAGVMELMPLEQFDEGKFAEMWRVNVLGPIYVTLEALPYLKRSRGAVVNIASIAGIGTALPNTTYYAVTKAAVIMLTRRLAYELAPYGVRVNAVAPSWIETDLTTRGRTREEVERAKADIIKRTSLGVLGTAEDVAKAVAFLLSDDARFVTGQVLVVDGGRVDYLTHGV
ncbi:MAG: glucose 1-dehydrogenase, partial [Thermoproteus sp.]|nr:glucose 1-dehydrogenase [Thermoproteus sp.]